MRNNWIDVLLGEVNKKVKEQNEDGLGLRIFIEPETKEITHRIIFSELATGVVDD